MILYNEEDYIKSYDEIIAEISPCQKYLRFNEIIGKGSSKTVYKALNIYKMCEVAYNIIPTNNMKIKDKERLVSEIKLLKSLDHKNIIKILDSWYNKDKKEVVFITEIHSYSLKTYITKFKLFKINHIKNWCKQILEGLEYLHSKEIIHRDLKCDNIFINSDTGNIFIGDFGLSVKTFSQTKSCVGTPEYMAPEIYDGDYTEKIDIYAFGMCLLEMLTLEAPYCECENIVQIYKKVTNNILPLSLNKVTNTELKNIILTTLNIKEKRPSASLLLQNFN